MLELDRQLRELIDNGATPVTADEIFAQHPPTERQSEPRTRRHRSRRSRTLLASGVAVAVVAGVSIGLFAVPGQNSLTASSAAAAGFLNATATIAQRQKPLIPGPGQYLYVATVVSLTNGNTMAPSPKMFYYYTNELVQTWTAPGMKGHQFWYVVGRPEFVSANDHSIWVIDGSRPLQSGSSSGNSAPYYDVANLPSKSSAILAFLGSQWYLYGAKHGRSAVWEFTSALAFLQNGASATQRAALLRFLATIPGVRLLGTAESMSTRKRGTVIGLPVPGRGLTVEAIFNPSTSELIETRTVVTAPAELSKVPQIAPLIHYVVGSIQTYTDYLFDGVSQLGAMPSKSPPLPKIWPSDSTRKPLVVVLDPKTGKVERVIFP